MKKTLLLFSLISISLMSFAQKSALRFDRQTYDFGEINQWNNPPATFIFTNTGKTDFMFLPTFPRDDIFIQLPKGKIQPGTADTITVFYFTSSTGVFQKNVELFTSSSGEPVSLMVKGNILSLDVNAYMSCPGFAPKVQPADEPVLVKKDTISKNEISVLSTDKNLTVMEFDDTEVPVSNTSTQTFSEILPENRYSPSNIVFLIDVSGSMKKADKLPLLKSSMSHLAKALRGIDQISVIVYANESSVLLPSTNANNKTLITSMIDSLKSGGFTNGVKGIETAYEMTEKHFINGGNNQIILATDGLFNNPGHSEKVLFDMVNEKSRGDIKLSVIAFGEDKEALKRMKKLAQTGKGSFIQIRNTEAARDVLVEEVKLQSLIK